MSVLHQIQLLGRRSHVGLDGGAWSSLRTGTHRRGVPEEGPRAVPLHLITPALHGSLSGRHVLVLDAQMEAKQLVRAQPRRWDSRGSVPPSVRRGPHHSGDRSRCPTNLGSTLENKTLSPSGLALNSGPIGQTHNLPNADPSGALITNKYSN